MRINLIPLLVILLLAGNPLGAQQAAGLFGPAPGGGPSGTGPTTASQLVTMYHNASAATKPLVTARYSLSHQQYTSVEGHPGTPGIVFGAGIVSGSTAIAPDLLYPLMDTYTGSSNDYTAGYGSDPGTGIDISASHAIQIQSFSDALIDARGANLAPVDARVWFADLTIDFNMPVSNPVFHVAGLGAWVFKGYTNQGLASNYDLGISVQLELLTPGLRLSRLSGNASFGVDSGIIIRNIAPYFGNGNPVHGISRPSAGGSAMLTGDAIRTVTFRIFLQGDGGIIVDDMGRKVPAAKDKFVAWSLPDNGAEPDMVTTAGDGFLLGISLSRPAAAPPMQPGMPGKTDRERIVLLAEPLTQSLTITPLQQGDIIELVSAATSQVMLRSVATGTTAVLGTQTLGAGVYTVNVYTADRRKKHSQKVVKL